MMETSTPKTKAIRPQLVLPLSRIVVESADRNERMMETSSSSSSELLMLSASELSASLASTLMTPIRHNHHLSRHHGLSPSNSHSSSFQLDLLSPSSSSSSHLTALQAQQQQQTEMSFTSAFTSTLRNRRGKTLILPKLKIPRSSKMSEAEEVDGGGREVQSSSIHQWRHSENLSTSSTHFRRSVSSSTFTESAAWYSSRQSSTSNMSEVISGSSWVTINYFFNE